MTRQVEQLFDDGTNTAIAERLFGEEYGTPTGVPALTPRGCICCGGTVDGKALRCGRCIAAGYEAGTLL